MIQEVVIAAFVLVTLQGVAGGAASPWEAWGSPWWLGWLVCVAPFVGLAVVGQGLSWWSLRRVNLGDAGAMGTLERGLMVLRGLAVLVHGVNCLVLGWPAVVRGVIGDVVAVDEWIAAAPPIAMVVLGWWWLEPVERRLREAVLARQLHEGAPIPGWPSRGAYVVFWARQSMLPVLAPIVMISVWGEAVEKAGGLMGEGAWGGWWPVAVHAVQFAGVAVILLFGAHVLRRVWHTERMPDSAVRDRLKAVCDRSRVRVRDLLLWRTGGTLHNAAVLGVLPPARFILVTDAMVESFPEELIEAVAAHEVGHVKRRHLLWLALATLAAVLVVGMGSQYAAWHAARWAGLLEGPSAWRDAMDGAAITATLAGSLLWFGWVSRRFEWQADAFAAWDLARAGGEAESGRVTAEAAGRVMEALGLVAAYNGLAPTRFMWRHGSIRTRQRRLRALVGAPMAGLPIDREVARIKAITVLGLAAAVCIVVVESTRSA